MNELRTALSAKAVADTESEADRVADMAPLIEAEDLLEEISIDGMCGVY
ncbi:mycofactocin precursor MftA [Streptomyces sp. NPDC001858]